MGSAFGVLAAVAVIGLILWSVYHRQFVWWRKHRQFPTQDRGRPLTSVSMDAFIEQKPSPSPTPPIQITNEDMPE